MAPWHVTVVKKKILSGHEQKVKQEKEVYGIKDGIKQVGFDRRSGSWMWRLLAEDFSPKTSGSQSALGPTRGISQGFTQPGMSTLTRQKTKGTGGVTNWVHFYFSSERNLFQTKEPKETTFIKFTYVWKTTYWPEKLIPTPYIETSANIMYVSLTGFIKLLRSITHCLWNLQKFTKCT